MLTDNRIVNETESTKKAKTSRTVKILLIALPIKDFSSFLKKNLLNPTKKQKVPTNIQILIHTT